MNAYRVWPDDDYAGYADDGVPDGGGWNAPAPAWRPEPPQWPRELMQEFERARDLWDTLARKLHAMVRNPAYDFVADPQDWYGRLWRVGWPAVTLVHEVYAMTRTAMIATGERIPIDPNEVDRLELSFCAMVHAWNFAVARQYVGWVEAARAKAARPAVVMVTDCALVPVAADPTRLAAPGVGGAGTHRRGRGRR